MFISEHRVNLRHLSKGRLLRPLFKMYWNPAHIQIEGDVVPAIACAQCESCAQGRMSRERQLLLYREDPDPHTTFALRRRIARKNERSLREVHLLGDGLHFTVSEAGRVQKHGERIPLKSP